MLHSAEDELLRGCVKKPRAHHDGKRLTWPFHLTDFHHEAIHQLPKHTWSFKLKHSDGHSATVLVNSLLRASIRNLRSLRISICAKRLSRSFLSSSVFICSYSYKFPLLHIPSSSDCLPTDSLRRIGICYPLCSTEYEIQLLLIQN